MGYSKTELDFVYIPTGVTATQGKFGYMFDSYSDVEKFSNDTFAKIPRSSRTYRITSKYATPQNRETEARTNIQATRGNNWFGTRDESFALEPLNRFLYADRLEVEVNKLNQRINKQNLVDIDQTKKIVFSEKEVGIFSFDLASLGLVRVYEYYSPLLKENVSPNMVVSKRTSGGDLLFYYVGNPYIEKHYIDYDTKRGGYYSAILGRMVDKKELIEEEGQNKVVALYYPEKELVPSHEVERIQAVDKNGKPKFSTTFKKCFIDIKKVKNRIPRIDIIVPVGYGANVTSEEAFWNCIQLLAITEKLSKSGINYRVIASVSDSSVVNRGNARMYKFVKLKDENQPLDPNSLSIMVSDMRFYRMINFFFKQMAQYDAGFEGDISNTITAPIRDSNEIKEAYINFLSKQTSESDQEAAKLPNSKIVLPYALTEAEALQGYNNTINIISNL